MSVNVTRVNVPPPPPPPIAPTPQLDEASVTVVSGMSQVASNFYNSAYYVLMNPSLLIIIVVVIGIFYFVFSSVGSGGGGGSASASGSFTSAMSDTFTRFQSDALDTAAGITGTGTGEGSSRRSGGGGWMWKAGLFLLVVLFLIYMFQYAFSSKYATTLKNIFSPSPELDVSVIPQDTSANGGGGEDAPKLLDRFRKQVFNIPGNNYTYDDANALCKAYGARLATYQEVEKAYNAGGEWCQYGWSQNQMALFPTQQATWDKLQTIEGHENDCGRPGVNGGYMANPNLRFGVNCYGVKPKMTEVEEDLMSTQPIYPKTVKDIEMEKRVEYWKSMLPKILVSPFNHNSWSKM